MTKRELRQLTYLKSEIKMLENQIDEVQEKINKYQIHDSVKASSAEFPYTQHSVSVSGIPDECYSDVWELRERLQDLKLQLKSRKIECEAEFLKLNWYIQSVPDSLIRQIMTYRYIKNLPWEQVAARIGKKYTGNYTRVALDEYLKRH